MVNKDNQDMINQFVKLSALRQLFLTTIQGVKKAAFALN